MANVTKQAVYELAMQVKRDLGHLADSLGEVKSEMQALRGHLLATQKDVHNIYTTLARHEVYLDRLERRLGLAEPATP